MQTIVIVGSKNEKNQEKEIHAFESAFRKHNFNAVVVDPTEQTESKPHPITSLVQDGSVAGVICFDKDYAANLSYPESHEIARVVKVGDDWMFGYGQSDVYKIVIEVVYWSRPVSLNRASHSRSLESKLGYLLMRAKQEPNSANRFQLGLALKEKGDLEKAFDEVHAAYKADPNNPEIVCEMFDILRKKPQLANKLESQGAIKKLFNRLTTWNTDERRSIIEELEKIVSRLEKSPTTTPEPYVFLGEFKLDGGDEKGAYEAYREAILRSGSRSLEKTLQSTIYDADMLRNIAFILQTTNARVKRLFPSKWVIGNVVLKPYGPDEGARAQVEHAFLEYGKKYSHLLRIDDDEIEIPKNSKLLNHPDDPKIIHRMCRLNGTSAFTALQEARGKDRHSLLQKLCTVAATIDHVFTNVVLENEPQFKSLINDSRQGFVWSRFHQKFLKPLEEIAGMQIPDDDLRILKDAAEIADNHFFKDTPTWLTVVRTDHCPHNYLVSPFGKVDFENNNLTYGFWDLVNLVEYPGTGLSDAESFLLAVDYMIQRLNLYTKPKSPRTLNQLLQGNKSRRYSELNAYVKNLSPEYCSPQESAIIKAKIQWLGFRFLRHMELAGLKMREEAGVVKVIDQINSKLDSRLFEDPVLANLEDPSGERALLKELRDKVQFYCNRLFEDRKYHVSCAQNSLRELTQIGLTDNKLAQAVGALYSLLNQKGYYDRATSPIIGSYRVSVSGPSSS